MEAPEGPEIEQFEFVPWAPERRPRSWRRFGLLAVVAVAGAFAGLAVARLGATPEAGLPVVSAVAPPPPSVTSPPPTLRLLSEADLHVETTTSEVPEASRLLAAAEEFVRDYFTTGPESDAGAASLVDGWVPSLSTYVEWADAVTVEERSDTWHVEVRYVVIVADAGLRRLPVQAVEVALRWTPGGGPVVVELPRVVEASPLVVDLSTHRPGEDGPGRPEGATLIADESGVPVVSQP